MAGDASAFIAQWTFLGDHKGVYTFLTRRFIWLYGHRLWCWDDSKSVALNGLNGRISYRTLATLSRWPTPHSRNFCIIRSLQHSGPMGNRKANETARNMVRQEPHRALEDRPQPIDYRDHLRTFGDILDHFRQDCAFFLPQHQYRSVEGMESFSGSFKHYHFPLHISCPSYVMQNIKTLARSVLWNEPNFTTSFIHAE